MSDSYAHAHLTIECSLDEAKQVNAALSHVEQEMKHWPRAPSVDELVEGKSELAAQPAWTRNLMITLANYLFDEEADGFSFYYTLALPTVHGRPVEDTQKCRGLTLLSHQAEDDLFDVTCLILAALNSDQMISTGLAYTSDKPADDAYGGNYVAINRHGWSRLFSGGDRTALENETLQNAEHFLVTYGPEGQAHRNSFLWTAPAGKAAADTILSQLSGSALPEEMEAGDLTLTRIPAMTYRHLKNALTTHQQAPEGTSMPNTQPA